MNITTEELARIRGAAIGDMLGDPKALDEMGPSATVFRLCREVEISTWTDDPPKVPGLYWTRKRQGDRPIIFIVYERKTPKGRVRIEARVFFSSTTSRTYRGEKPEHLGLEWAGPIPEPREPK